MRICDRLKGSPDLAIEILKKIDSSTVFVGDAMPVGKGAPHKTDVAGQSSHESERGDRTGICVEVQVDRERPNDHELALRHASGHSL